MRAPAGSLGDSRPFVLALSGPPGAGKTTLLRALARRRPSARAIHYDRYQPLTHRPLAEVRAWFARGGDPNEIDHGDLVAELRRETSRPGEGPQPSLLLFETPFGRLHRDTGAFIDALVWIDTPLDIALSRAMLASALAARSEVSRGAAQGFLDWQVQYLGNYPVVRPMYLGQRASIEPHADLTLEGSLPTERAADLVEAALEGWEKARPSGSS